MISKTPRLRRTLALGLALLACLTTSAVASAAGRAGAYVASPPHLRGPAIGSLSKPSAISDGCLFAIFDLSCYGPYELGRAYNFPAGLDGTGQTIVIVDAYGSPTIRDDVARFDEHFKVPAPPSLTIVGPNGSGDQNDPNVQGWGLETSLDVEYAHAMAPGANIVLSVAASDDNRAVNAAVARVLFRYPGAILSFSFGADETLAARSAIFDEATMHFLLAGAQSLGDTVVVAAGDGGATNGNAALTAAFPASDPLVTAVGGTQGNPYPTGLYANGGYGGEAVWNEPDQGGATGGAPSAIFPAPPWQRGVTGNRRRTTPDVSYNAAINGGIEVMYSPYTYLVGGTSAAAPQWAAVFALANQARAQAGQRPLGLANPALYSIGQDSRRYASDFHDIVSGDNILVGSTLGFAAKPGYDIASGWGTPNVANLVHDLLDSTRRR